eukprot:m.5027 g.5027  ORF g.5027 m.5027 type:complete len:831 (+) comp1967_c0_seq1:50-2542(+)
MDLASELLADDEIDMALRQLLSPADQKELRTRRENVRRSYSWIVQQLIIARSIGPEVETWLNRVIREFEATCPRGQPARSIAEFRSIERSTLWNPSNLAEQESAAAFLNAAKTAIKSAWTASQHVPAYRAASVLWQEKKRGVLPDGVFEITCVLELPQTPSGTRLMCRLRGTDSMAVLRQQVLQLYREYLGCVDPASIVFVSHGKIIPDSETPCTRHFPPEVELAMHFEVVLPPAPPPTRRVRIPQPRPEMPSSVIVCVFPLVQAPRDFASWVHCPMLHSDSIDMLLRRICDYSPLLLSVAANSSLEGFYMGWQDSEGSFHSFASSDTAATLRLQTGDELYVTNLIMGSAEFNLALDRARERRNDPAGSGPASNPPATDAVDLASAPASSLPSSVTSSVDSGTSRGSSLEPSDDEEKIDDADGSAITSTPADPTPIVAENPGPAPCAVASEVPVLAAGPAPPATQPSQPPGAASPSPRATAMPSNADLLGEELEKLRLRQMSTATLSVASPADVAKSAQAAVPSPQAKNSAPADAKALFSTVSPHGKNAACPNTKPPVCIEGLLLLRSFALPPDTPPQAIVDALVALAASPPGDALHVDLTIHPDAIAITETHGPVITTQPIDTIDRYGCVHDCRTIYIVHKTAEGERCIAFRGNVSQPIEVVFSKLQTGLERVAQRMAAKSDAIRKDVEAALRGHPDGTYVLRESLSRSNHYAISVAHGADIKHCLIEMVGGLGGRVRLPGADVAFEDLDQLVAHYVDHESTLPCKLVKDGSQSWLMSRKNAPIELPAMPRAAILNSLLGLSGSAGPGSHDKLGMAAGGLVAAMAQHTS